MPTSLILKNVAFLLSATLIMPFYNFAQPGTWKQLAPLPAGQIGTTGAVAFTIGNKGYVGTGGVAYDSTTRSLWEFDGTGKTWSQKADYPGACRAGLAGFSMGDKGYMGTGFTRDSP